MAGSVSETIVSLVIFSTRYLGPIRNHCAARDACSMMGSTLSTPSCVFHKYEADDLRPFQVRAMVCGVSMLWCEGSLVMRFGLVLTSLDFVQETSNFNDPLTHRHTTMAWTR